MVAFDSLTVLGGLGESQKSERDREIFKTNFLELHGDSLNPLEYLHLGKQVTKVKISSIEYLHLGESQK